MRRALEFRAPINLALAAAVGLVGLHNWPFPADEFFLTVIDARKPWLFEGIAYLHATLCFGRWPSGHLGQTHYDTLKDRFRDAHGPVHALSFARKADHDYARFVEK